MMPNRYLPSALSALVEEQHEALLDAGLDKGDDSDDDYVPEHAALASMLKPEHQQQYKQRRDLDDATEAVLDV